MSDSQILKFYYQMDINYIQPLQFIYSIQITNVQGLVDLIREQNASSYEEREIYINFKQSHDVNDAFEAINSVFSIGSIVLLVWFLRSQNQRKKSFENIFNPGNITSSKAKLFNVDKDVQIKFQNVAGLKEEKKEVTEIIDFLKQPQKYLDMGAKLPKGLLFTGPPGTGKTLLAKACAGEAGVPFLFVSGSEFQQMFVGVGPKRVRNLFKQAKKHSPCIVFIDEIDAVGGKRSGHTEEDNTLNELLIQMDGFETSDKVIILGATNREDMLDEALKRPGRFDRIIKIDLPNLEDRVEIFHEHLSKIVLDPEQTLEEYANRLATLSPGFSGAEIAALCNEAALLAVRENQQFVNSFHFEMASERVLAGLPKKSIMSQEERRKVAIHEAGHAVTAWFTEGGMPLLKLTIIPRSKGSLGFAQYLPNESMLQNEEQMFDQLCCTLGGRCAEEEFYEGEITTGAYDDLSKVYDLARTMVSKYGMEKSIGYVSFQETQYQKTYGSHSNYDIDKQTQQLIDVATLKSRQLCKQYKNEILALAEGLLEKETLNLKDIVSILGPRPFEPKESYKKYLEVSNS